VNTKKVSGFKTGLFLAPRRDACGKSPVSARFSIAPSASVRLRSRQSLAGGAIDVRYIQGFSHMNKIYITFLD